MKNKEITLTRGDSTGKIDDLIDFLVTAKVKGATDYLMRWSGDPHWDYKWFETYKVLSDEEIKQQEIKDLEFKLEQLKK